MFCKYGKIYLMRRGVAKRPNAIGFEPIKYRSFESSHLCFMNAIFGESPAEFVGRKYRKGSTAFAIMITAL